MTWTDLAPLRALGALDLLAVALLVIPWALIGWRIDHATAKRPSVSMIMANYRREWMHRMIARDVRIFDAQVIATLRQGTSFFASTSVIAIGGVLALLGNADRVAGLAEDLTATRDPAILWEIKLLLIVVFLTNGFLKFVWSNRLFGYCSVIMAAVPNDVTDPAGPEYARKAGELNVTAARSFNRGLRSIYMALASVAWLAGPFALIVASFVTCVIIWRREFASQSRAALLDDGGKPLI
ncbi:DUF599 domain-containing protein [Sulfitobacter albidus]|uniref:DUF599 domain-containing protein n=1 Tax=Sulfitobacter albidus TaxID=2829501 RepID=A0A975JDD0_9RHOB|nr:DUF599 domain-containing protein [Sulfitobacter albidus]QUJ76396.1 DUF599 domain-containing protein [Sulfitobacter albidus]